MLKRFVNLLVIVMFLSIFNISVFASKDNGLEKVNFLKEKGIIDGYPDGSLGLEKNLKRSEITKILVYSLGDKNKAIELQGKEIPFSDVGKDYWANGVISYAKNNMNLISGYPDGTFKGEKNITNAELLKILVCHKKNLNKTAINNAKWPYDWIKWAEEENICGKNINPNSFALRKDAFQYLYNTIYSNSENYKSESKKSKNASIITKETKESRHNYNYYENKENNKKSNNTLVSESSSENQHVIELKKILKAIIDSRKDDLLELGGVKTPKNEKSIADLKSLIEEAKILLNKKDLSSDEIKKLEELTKFEGKKYRGSFRKVAKNILVDSEVLGERDARNKNNGKYYTSLQNNQIRINTPLSDVKKIGESEERYIKLNYISKKDYDSVDAISKSTPKYNKQELNKDLYSVEEKDGIITVTINGELPEDVKILKPIIYLKYADNIYFENGDLVYTKIPMKTFIQLDMDDTTFNKETIKEHLEMDNVENIKDIIVDEDKIQKVQDVLDGLSQEREIKLNAEVIFNDGRIGELEVSIEVDKTEDHDIEFRDISIKQGEEVTLEMIKNAISTPNLPEIKEIKVDKNKLEDIKKAVITPPLEEITVMLSVDIDFADGTSGSGFFNVIVKKAD
ncbi:MAG: S-layer homology domain-containing protein [Peptoniphilus harei]|uniref:S-layer homology domain-containing protein n=1 Tax=Peptoniphilus harei TaxID=54005 RepID=UPI0029026811|nr:S-layer homology domain-containing protein [Peptoniphilus harei]MDU1643001.1 S-layer homology domain-containing protein [Peptoniphilus harei]MDU3086716.1 S-layer homology domain-containing protein [Peptoniphilus harei]